MMPRVYAICHGGTISACPMCKRFAPNNGSAMHERQQAFIAPQIEAGHCANFIECPPYQIAAVTPTDTR